MQTLKYYLMVFMFYLFRIFPIKKNKIVVSMFAGKGYGDNGKAIVNSLRKDSNEYDIVWLCKDCSEKFPAGVRAVPIVSLKSVYEQCTAKVWIDNRRKPGYVRKRKEQYYINTCHGNHGLKKVEFDAEAVLSSAYLRAALNDSQMTNVVLSSSSFDTTVFRNGYRYSCEILEIGYPRQDMLFRGDETLKNEVKQKLGIPRDHKVLLYVPTFRNQMNAMDLSVYQLDWVGVLGALQNRFGTEWSGIARLHPNISALSGEWEIPENVVDATNYPDMGELMLIADCVISDYSSCIIEGGIAGKMCFFFAKDIAEYEKDRNFYIPIEQFPFPLARNNDELISFIDRFEQETYSDGVHHFFYGHYGLKITGRASELAAERIRAIMFAEYLG